MGIGIYIGNTIGNSKSNSPSWTQLQIEAVKPTNLTAVWVNDYVQIDFTDNSGGLVQHEIVEANGVGSYSVVTILAKGVTNYHNYT